MKNTRKFGRSLSSHFNQSVKPIYLVNANREIVYMNAACLSWVGLEAESATGLHCFYTSEQTEDPEDDPVKGLCPPPEVFSADPDSQASDREPMVARVFAFSEQGPDWRTATIERLLDDDEELLGVLVIVAIKMERESEEHSTMLHREPVSLHEALVEIRDHYRQNYSIGNLIGASAFAERLRRQTDVIVGLDAETLITGPPGSGREHLARTIATACCDQDDFPVAVLHCVLADDELTQETINQVADRVMLRTRRGRVVPSPGEDRTKPILMLLDIDKLASSGLAIVKSFLKRIKTGCRVIATSEASLIELADANRFPSDMAHLLTTIEVPLISLSQRRDDIPLMAQAFVEYENRTRETQLSGFDIASLQLLSEFHWPGNLEQLQQVVVEACEVAGGPKITTEDLPDAFRHAVQAFRIGEAEETQIDLQQWLEQLELELIQRAVGEARGNKTKAAKLLNITRSKLIRRMDHFGIKPSSATVSADSKDTNEDMIDPSAFEELE